MHVCVCVFVCANIIYRYVHNIYIYYISTHKHTSKWPTPVRGDATRPLHQHIYIYIHTYIWHHVSTYIYTHTYTYIHIHTYNTITHLLFTHPCQCTRGFRGPLPRHRSPRTTAKRHVPRAAAARTARRWAARFLWGSLSPHVTAALFYYYSIVIIILYFLILEIIVRTRHRRSAVCEVCTLY